MLKTFNKLGNDGMHLKITWAIYNKPTANIILDGQKLEVFPLKTSAMDDKDSLTSPIKHSIGSFGQGNQARERSKEYSVRKRGSQIVSADDMIVYLENPIVSSQNFLW